MMTLLSCQLYFLRRRNIEQIFSYLEVLERALGSAKLGWQRFHDSGHFEKKWYVLSTPKLALSFFVLQFCAILAVAVYDIFSP